MWGGCGKVYGVSGEVCWRVGKGCGEGNGEDVGTLNTLLIPHISLPSPFATSPLTSPTPHHTFLHLLSYLFPHPFILPPHPNTFSYYPHISLHLLKVWRSYHVTKFVWRSYHVAKLLATTCNQVIGLDYTDDVDFSFPCFCFPVSSQCASIITGQVIVGSHLE